MPLQQQKAPVFTGAFAFVASMSNQNVTSNLSILANLPHRFQKHFIQLVNDLMEENFVLSLRGNKELVLSRRGNQHEAVISGNDLQIDR